MALAVGDYVQLSRRYPPRLRSGTRGEVVRIDSFWATVRLPQGGFFEAHTDHLSRLVGAQAL